MLICWSHLKHFNLLKLQDILSNNSTFNPDDLSSILILLLKIPTLFHRAAFSHAMCRKSDPRLRQSKRDICRLKECTQNVLWYSEIEREITKTEEILLGRKIRMNAKIAANLFHISNICFERTNPTRHHCTSAKTIFWSDGSKIPLCFTAHCWCLSKFETLSYLWTLEKKG